MGLLSLYARLSSEAIAKGENIIRAVEKIRDLNANIILCVVQKIVCCTGDGLAGVNKLKLCGVLFVRRSRTGVCQTIIVLVSICHSGCAEGSLLC